MALDAALRLHATASATTVVVEAVVVLPRGPSHEEAAGAPDGTLSNGVAPAAQR